MTDNPKSNANALLRLVVHNKGRIPIPDRTTEKPINNEEANRLLRALIFGTNPYKENP